MNVNKCTASKNRAGHGGREETRADNKLDSYQFNTHIMES